MSIIKKYAKNTQRASIDEAYIDLSEEVNEEIERMQDSIPRDDQDQPEINWDGAGNLYGDAANRSTDGWKDLALRIGADFSSKIRKAIWEELGYTCSSGIAHNKTLAKLCSSMNKPNKQTILRDCEVINFMRDIPFGKIRNLGGKFGHEIEEKLGVETASDIWNFSMDALIKDFGPERGPWLYNIARGVCNEQVSEVELPKSMGAHKALRPTVTTDAEMNKWMDILAAEIFYRLEAEFEENRRFIAEGQSIFPCNGLGISTSGLEIVDETIPKISTYFSKAPATSATQTTPKKTPPNDESNNARTEMNAASDCHWFCEECKMSFQDERAEAEHRDYHFARSLQQEERYDVVPQPVPPPKSASKGKPTSKYENSYCNAAGRNRGVKCLADRLFHIKVEHLSHSQRVRRLYKKSLKLTQDWFWQREEAREKCVIIRHLFDQNRNVTNPHQLESLFVQAEHLLAKYHHPSPYISPAAPGGSKWERNIPFPEELIRRGVTPFE
ncbi:DNA-directed DNA polymerase eta rad30 [Phlyctochytrium planicorne]|nr:DNA-directed DNA polymerase eta rad30 [Phlyctochytrium planicorne]